MPPFQPAFTPSRQQPIVADEQRPGLALPLGGERLDVLRSTAAVLDADDVLLLAQEPEIVAGGIGLVKSGRS